MEEKMPDKYERMAQLRDILRHMFEISHEFYTTIQTLDAENRRLEKSEQLLQATLDKLSEELESARSSAERDLTERTALYEKQLADKTELITNLNNRYETLKDSVDNLDTTLKTDKSFHGNISNMAILLKVSQDYRIKKDQLSEWENTLEARENKLASKEKVQEEIREELEQVKAELHRQKNENSKLRRELDDISLKEKVTFRQISNYDRDVTPAPDPVKPQQPSLDPWKRQTFENTDERCAQESTGWSKERQPEPEQSFKPENADSTIIYKGFQEKGIGRRFAANPNEDVNEERISGGARTENPVSEEKDPINNPKSVKTRDIIR